MSNIIRPAFRNILIKLAAVQILGHVAFFVGSFAVFPLSDTGMAMLLVNHLLLIGTMMVLFGHGVLHLVMNPRIAVNEKVLWGVGFWLAPWVILPVYWMQQVFPETFLHLTDVEPTV